MPQAASTVSDHLVERLHHWQVRRVFGYPGDGINAVIEALQRGADEASAGAPEFVQIQHEALAAFMAGAHAKFTGDVGVCLATSGPGAIQLVQGLYDAKLDHQPVVAIVGQRSPSVLGGEHKHEGDLVALFNDVASAFCQTVAEPAQLRDVVDRAFYTALNQRGVACVILPSDVQRLPAADTAPRVGATGGALHSGLGRAAGAMEAEPVPPHPAFEPLRAYAAAVLKGDRHALAKVRTMAREWWAGLGVSAAQPAPLGAMNARDAEAGSTGSSETDLTSTAGEEDPGAAMDAWDDAGQRGGKKE